MTLKNQALLEQMDSDLVDLYLKLCGKLPQGQQAPDDLNQTCLDQGNLLQVDYRQLPAQYFHEAIVKELRFQKEYSQD